MIRTARVHDRQTPLVSIVVHNQNGAEYLEACFDAVLTQTYDNIEIIFYDCASTDGSWGIASAYQTASPGIVSLLHLRRDYSPDDLITHPENIRGRYFMKLPANVRMEPGTVSAGVDALWSNPNVAFARYRINIPDCNGNWVSEPPLYGDSCLVPGVEHLPVHLMVSPRLFRSAVMFDTDIARTERQGTGYLGQAYLCLKYDMVYINEPLVSLGAHRRDFVPGEPPHLSDLFTLYAEKMALLRHVHFVHGDLNMGGQLPQVLRALGQTCLSDSVQALQRKDEDTARKMLRLAAAVDLTCEKEETFQLLDAYWSADGARKKSIMERLASLGCVLASPPPFPMPGGSRALRPTERR